MTPRIKRYPNGWEARLYQVDPWTCASVRDSSGKVYDAIRLENPRHAREYFRVFDKIARNGGPG